MSAAEAEYYAGLLSTSETVVEYGVGRSTLMALNERNVRRLLSVESDTKWAAKIKRKPLVEQAIANGIATIIYVDVGTTRNFGVPVDEKKRMSGSNTRQRPGSVLSARILCWWTVASGSPASLKQF